MIRVRVRRLSKSYRLWTGEDRQVLSEIDLDVNTGEFLCVLGPSGCGKTTLLNMLSGIDTSYTGRIDLVAPRDGRVGSDGVAVSYMFQECRLLPWLTVRENLRFVLDGDRNATLVKQSIESWLERIGLADHGDYYPLQLSAGMQQRVALARALLREPDLLLLDEPFRSLDEWTASRMRRELFELWNEHRCTVIFVSHNPLEVAQLADRAVVMASNPGRIMYDMHIGSSRARPRDTSDPGLWEVSGQLVRALTSECGALRTKGGTSWVHTST